MSKNSVVLSIVIPLFNKERFILDLVCQLMGQICKFDEIIIIDDCSSDTSLSLLTNHSCSNDSRLKVVKLSKNCGPSKARNIGSSIAIGTHVLFFDADDLPAPKLVQYLKSAILENIDTLMFTYRISFESHGLESNLTHELGKLSFSRRGYHAFAHDLLRGKTLCTASSTCLNRKLLGLSGIGFREDLHFCEDPELWIRLSAENNIIEINNYLATYRDVDNSQSYIYRGDLQSVNKYLETVLGLYRLYGHLYRNVLFNIIIKNLVYSKIQTRRQISTYSLISNYRDALGLCRFMASILVSIMPQSFHRFVVKQKRFIHKLFH